MDGGIALDGAISKLTPQDQRELQQFVQNESQKNQIQQSTSASQSSRGEPYRLVAQLLIPACSCSRSYREMLQAMYHWVLVRRKTGE
jgi:hypothetical protein